MSDPLVKRGSCLCGAVHYTARMPMRPVVFCHCIECRKQSGHIMAATAVTLSRFVIIEDRGLRWYQASNAAKRGFCSLCGSTLFWLPENGDFISIAAGSIDGPTELESAGHIFCAEKGDYYEIDGRTTFRLPHGGHAVKVP